MFESFLKIVGGKLIDIVKESNEFRAIPIPDVDNNGKFDYYFINKRSISFSINSMGMSVDLLLINNSEKTIKVYIYDNNGDKIFTIANHDEKYIIMNKNDTKKIQITNIDLAEQCYIMYSKDSINYSPIPIV